MKRLDELTEEHLCQIEARALAATAGPLEVETSIDAHRTGSIHLSIRTAYKPSDTPWSPRYLAWMCGGLLCDPGNHLLPRWHWCDTCKTGHYDGYKVPVEIRVDQEINADAQLFAHAREDVLLLANHLRDWRMRASGFEREYDTYRKMWERQAKECQQLRQKIEELENRKEATDGRPTCPTA